MKYNSTIFASLVGILKQILELKALGKPDYALLIERLGRNIIDAHNEFQVKWSLQCLSSLVILIFYTDLEIR